MKEATKYVNVAPRIRITITQEIIDSGVARNSNHCIVAEAVRAAHPELKFIAVDLQTVRASDPMKRLRYQWFTPRCLQELLVRFDQGIKPKPCTTELRIGQVTEMRIPAKKGRATKKKAALLRRPKNGQERSVPIKVGGRMPPRSIGQVRAFGLRSFQI